MEFRELLPVPADLAEGVGYKLLCSRFRVESFVFRVQGSGFRVQGGGLRELSPVSLVGLGCRVYV